MKTKYPSMFGILAIFMLVASLVVPANLASPTPVSADAGICKWDTLEMPNSVLGKYDVYNGSEINKLVVGPNAMLAIVDTSMGAPYYKADIYGPLALAAASYWGILWDFAPYEHLVTAMDTQFTVLPEEVTTPNASVGGHNVWDVAVAPDDANFWAVVTSGATGPATAWVDGPVEVWVTENAGASWDCAGFAAITGATLPTNVIGCIDVSPDYGGKRDIAVGIRTGTAAAAFTIYVVQSRGFASWVLQSVTPTAATADVLALKFSPTYVGDAAMAVVYADTSDTFYDVALRDLDDNDVNEWVFGTPATSVEVTAGVAGTSPTATLILTADLELPSDFSGQSASLRRAYVSTDDTGAGGLSAGIFRMDDTTVYALMDLTGNTTKRVASIAYYGTYASGKLLAGEVLGDDCAATVPTWFTDSPTTCPIPCWYPALKPTTGAAGTIACNGTNQGNAQVAWRPDGVLALVGTGSNTREGGATWYGPLNDTPIPNDESAFAISRNNGETWNQLSLIDTTISYFNDVAPSADCTTIYLASANATGATSCEGFDSVWRTTVNPEVSSPLPPVFPLGFYYERVYCRVTALNCAGAQSNLPLLRLAPDKTNGEIVGWAAQNTKAQAWSPDFGDYWANINPRDTIQDFAFASSTLLYNLSFSGLVQKMPYTGTAWSTAEASVDSGDYGHMIAVMGDNLLVGYDAAATYPGSISFNGGASFGTLFDLLPTSGSAHVAFHPDFASNGTFFLADDAANGTVYRNKYPVSNWADLDMMAVTNQAFGCGGPHPIGQYGLQLATTGANNDYALYSAHNLITDDADTQYTYGGVCRTLWPLWGLPKPGMAWDCLWTGLTAGVEFTLEPWSLKKCGCLTLDTDTKLWALDDAAYAPEWYGIGKSGYLWGFADCMAKTGPALITEDGILIGCDPVSGRAQEVDLRWEQLCVATGYDIEIGKDAAFTIKVIDWVSEAGCTGFLSPESSTSPAAYIPAGGLATLGSGNSQLAASGNLECGHTYYWHAKVRQCATGQIIRSPWSETRSFTIKAGLPVSADYYGLKLLSPDNGCISCAVSPVSFSWSPFKDTLKYKFVLAKDAAMTDVLAEAEVPTTAYEYEGTLDYSTNYFWRVMCVEPAPSDWSATFSFQTEAAPTTPEAPPEAPATPLWVWIVIAIGAILVIVTLVLIFKTRRV